jgi:hypothetical protein
MGAVTLGTRAIVRQDRRDFRRGAVLHKHCVQQPHQVVETDERCGTFNYRGLSRHL